MKPNRHIMLSLSTWVLVLLSCVAWGTGAAKPVYTLSAAREGKSCERWVESLRAQLENRTGRDPQIWASAADGTERLDVVLDADPTLAGDYAIRREGQRLILCARNEAVMKWLTYQFLSWAATRDQRVRADDLPPAIVDMEQGSAGRFAFEYRGIYSPTNCDPDYMAIAASHNVDFDWGLWGHNLPRVVGGSADERVYALHDGTRDHSQFCFSSEQLYDRIVAYVVDNYGEGTAPTAPKAGAEVQAGSRFCIMPNDNAVVCQCEECRKAGNDSRSATPTVARLLRRLAERFPHHSFFTTAYLTTRQAPQGSLPENTGVIISAIDLPLRYGTTQTEAWREFAAQVNAWKKVVRRVYVWDYMRNYDDYLTPFPVVGILRERLAAFQSVGVNGLFYNGSGYDYASLDDVQTFAVTALLKDPRLAVEPLLRAYLDRFYPRSGDLIFRYYAGLERRVVERRSVLEFYGGIDAAVAGYLDPAEFVAFFRELDARSKSIDGGERARLNRLLTALNFTMLELLRTPRGVPYDAVMVGECLDNLAGHAAFPEMKGYREAGGTLDGYMDGWRRYGVRSGELSGAKRVEMEVVWQDEDGGKTPLAMLTDGYGGLPSDYHTAWYQFRKGSLVAERRFDAACRATVRVGLMAAPKWRIGPEGTLVVSVNGREVASVDLTDVLEADRKSVYTCEVELRAGDLLRIVVKPDVTSGHTVACDEIEVYEKK